MTPADWDLHRGFVAGRNGAAYDPTETAEWREGWLIWKRRNAIDVAAARAARARARRGSQSRGATLGR